MTIIKKTNMSDVAKAVGVSKTTISRYLHGEYDFMSKETKEKISAVIKQLDYRPNKFAQGLKLKKSNIIGVSIADIGNPFSSLLLKGIQSKCRKHHFQLLVSDANNNLKYEQENIESLLDAQVDGLIINTVGNNYEYLKKYLQKKTHKPIVLLDRIYQPLICDCVTTNNYEITHQLLNKLYQQNFSYIIFLTPEIKGISTRTIRKRAVEDFLKKNKLQGKTIILKKNSKIFISKLLSCLYQHSKDKICVFINNEETLHEFLDILPSTIYKKIGICSFADKRWVKYSYDGITCIDQNPYLMGEISFQQLIKNIKSPIKIPELIEVPGTIYFYKSTDI